MSFQGDQLDGEGLALSGGSPSTSPAQLTLASPPHVALRGAAPAPTLSGCPGLLPVAPAVTAVPFSEWKTRSQNQEGQVSAVPESPSS